MMWRTEIVIRVLLLVAKIMADDPDVKRDVTNLSNHINSKSLI